MIKETEKLFKNLLWTIFMPLAVIYLEVIYRFVCMGRFSAFGLGAMLAFSAAAGCLITAVSALCGAKAFRAVTSVLLALVTVLFGVQTVYRRIFRTTLGVGLMSNAKNAFADFGGEAVTGIVVSLPKILLLLVPLALWMVFSKRLVPKIIDVKCRILLLLVFAVIQLVTVRCVKQENSDALSLSFYYGDGFVLDSGVEAFGLLTAQRLDTQAFFGESELEDDFVSVPLSAPRPVSTPMPQATQAPAEELSEEVELSFVPEPHVLDIDFSALYETEKNQTAKVLHSFFSAQEPSYTNEYTGIFEGKNLIWICAESFSPFGVDEIHTPTLYRLTNSGFVFENFYCPLTYASTTGGEFITLTGLMQNSSKSLMQCASTNYLPYAMGNILSPQGYTSLAFHNGSYSFYGRNYSHPNFGYDYRALGHGLSLSGPQFSENSDLDMMKVTVDEYIDSDHFNIYYMTRSAHMPYNSSANPMCVRYQEDVKDLENYTRNARSYVASNMDFDRAVEYLLDRLEEAGKLEDTVIVISPDHYPYGLSTKDLESIAGGEIDTEFDTVHSTLIIYSGCLEEPIHIEKYCSSIDILPTIMNLFGMEFDSRIIMGRDILSDTPGFIAFPTYSFLTDFGRYNGRTGEFTAYDPDYELPDGYIKDTIERIRTLYKYSEQVINCDYYSTVMPKNE